MNTLIPESVDVAAGLVFVYLFMSALATIGREALEGFVKSRARNLEKGLVELLCDQPQDKSGKAKNTAYELLKGFYEHPLIMTLYRGKYTIPPKRGFSQGRKLPSYIPSDHFAYVVLDMLAEKGGQITGSLDPQSILAAAEGLDNRRLAKMVQFAIHNSGGDVDKARQFLETWFNATMDRVSGWYRLETQTILFWISLVACIVLNVNTVVIADSLWRSPSLRKTVELQAEAYYRANPDAITAMPPGGATDPADTARAAPAADTVPVAEAPVTPVTQPAPLPDPISAKAAFKASADVPGQINPTDPLEKLGLPLGWNKETITAMHRLFPTPPRAVDGNQKRVAWQERMEARKAAGETAHTHKPTILGWFHHRFRQIEAFWQDVRDAYDEGGQDPTKNALFTAAGTLSLFMGWVMTAFAVTLGAPFWFDVLGKLMMVRSTLKPGKGGGAPPSNLESALVAAFAPSAGDSGGQTQTLLPYKPGSGVSAAALPASAGDNVNGIDPNDRPRDA
ncbi:MAG TPA: hypothetical protein VG839_04595 [Asticcacaulis sp.]|nr:hypothetical protein [Asticcacaulis sp.]